MKTYAHSLSGRPESEWQELEDHLRGTAKMAEEFTSCFAPGWGKLAGLWHDAGKYQSSFQEYIRKDASAHIRGLDHSSAGAAIAKNNRAPALSFVVAGHHGGWPGALDLPRRFETGNVLLAAAR